VAERNGRRAGWSVSRRRSVHHRMEIDAGATPLLTSAEPGAMSRTSVAVRCCPCHSPTLRPWIDHRTAALLGEWPSYVEEFWSRSLAGHGENGWLKHTLIPKRHFRHDAPRVFLSQAGPRIDLWVFQAGHQSFRRS